MIKIGITGQSGFIGSHLYNTIGLSPEKFERIEFYKDFYTDAIKLETFVKNCDVIVHLAAINRHEDPMVIYDTNVQLVQKLIDACKETKSTPHILFSSSTQEELNNYYGNSKREGRECFVEWAKKNCAKFSGLVIPNVFGPFGKPYYNSVVATFCHQFTHDETPKVKSDSEIQLIYVGDLVNEIIDQIEGVDEENKSIVTAKIEIKPTVTINVSVLYDILKKFKESYFEKGIIPDLNDKFQKNLFNTFLCYIDHEKHFPFYLNQHMDDRGSFVELIKLNSGGQVSFSTTLPGITRGNHFHTHKAERFAVIKGKARIQLRRIGTNKILTFDLNGNKPAFVDMPVWFTHNITNIGDVELYTIFWISEQYCPKNSDTYYKVVRI